MSRGQQQLCKPPFSNDTTIMAANYLIFCAFLQTTSTIVLTANVSTFPVMYLTTIEALGPRSKHHPLTTMQTTGQENIMSPSSSSVDHDVPASVHLLRPDPENQANDHYNTTSEAISSSSAYFAGETTTTHSNNCILGNYTVVERFLQPSIWSPLAVVYATSFIRGIVNSPKIHSVNTPVMLAIIHDPDPYLFKAKDLKYLINVVLGYRYICKNL